MPGPHNWTPAVLGDPATLASWLAEIDAAIYSDQVESDPMAAPAESAVVSILASGHGFTAPAPSPVSNVDDTAVWLFGTQSLRLTTQGAGTSQTARKTGLTAIDMTGKMFRVTFRVDKPTKLANLRFDVSSDSFTNWSRGLFVTSNATIISNPLIAPDTWYQMTVPWSLFTVGGGAGATRSAITAVQMVAVDDGGGANSHVNVYLQKIATVAEPANCVITFTFDDGRDGAYTKARPILDAAGYRASWAPIIDKIGVTNYMTYEQNLALLEAGWDACVHAFSSSVHNNYDTVTDAAAVADTLAAKAWMRKHGFGYCDTLLVPLGKFDSVARDTAYKQNFSLARGINGSSRETYPPGRPWNLRSYNPGNKSVATVEGIIDAAVAGKDWLILQLHNVADASDGDNNTVLTANLQSIVDYIVSQGSTVRVKTFAEVLATGVA